MSRRRRGRSDSDSEFEDCKYEYYKDLRDGRTDIWVFKGSFRCPFCKDTKKEYAYRDMIRHASRIGRESRSATFKDRAKHLGLERYLERDFYRKVNSPKSSRRSIERVENRRHAKTESSQASKAGFKTLGAFQDDKSTLEEKLASIEPGEIVEDGKQVEPSGSMHLCPLSKSTKMSTESFRRKADEELIVWPWMAVVANIPLVYTNGRYVGDSGKKQKDEWTKQGYNPVKVHPLWSFRGHSGYAIVEFEKDWVGFNSAMTFVKAFEINNHGRNDWYYGAKHKDDKLYAWIARDKDYDSKGLIGDYLQKHGDLKTISDIEREDKRKHSKLVSGLCNMIEEKGKECEKIKKEISRTEFHMVTVVRQKEEMVQAYNKEMERMKEEADEQLRRILREHEDRKYQLEIREKELKQREARNENEKRKLENQKKMNERAILEQKKADERMLMLAEDQKRQKEELHQRIIDLERKLDEKQRLELEINQMKGAMEVMKHMSESGDNDAKKTMESIENDIKEKEEELESLEELNQQLIIKQRNTNDEVQDARKELIKGLQDNKSRNAHIGVKRMGELDDKPFHIDAKNKGCDPEKGMVLCSLWEDHLRDPSWHPYKIITTNGVSKEIIDEEDEKIQSLKSKYGDKIYNAVVTALNEMNDYNPSGRYPVAELWNNKENRKATLREAVAYILRQWKQYRQKKN